MGAGGTASATTVDVFSIALFVLTSQRSINVLMPFFELRELFLTDDYSNQT